MRAQKIVNNSLQEERVEIGEGGSDLQLSD